ncbi:hypothetical protein MPSEU_000163500 [Mayamaea pseudoterrestris]|nr:hypothetical protein MPSEU_000163500 [Mayamaea pseudoterrestris]
MIPLIVQLTKRRCLVNTCIGSRCFAASSSSATTSNHQSASSFKPSTPSLALPTWERVAHRCKNPREQRHNAYIQEIRSAVHDSPTMHLQSLAHELQSAIGGALGKQGRKVVSAIRVLEEQLQKYHQLVEQVNDERDSVSTETLTELRNCIQAYNTARKQALTARWELMVHRQAAGFVVNNHSIVSETFPIPGPLNESDVISSMTSNRASRGEPNVKGPLPILEQQQQKHLDGQLDWWQRIGRWK